MSDLGSSLNQTSRLNVLLCKPPKHFRPDQWKAAIEACRPRLRKDLDQINPGLIIAFGSYAVKALTGKNSVVPWYGSPLPSFYGPPVFPMLHPAFILRSPAYRPVFKGWMKAALELANGGKQHKWERLIVEPPFEPSLRELLERSLKGETIAIDIENNPSTGNIRCIGVSTPDLGVSVPFDERPNDMVLSLLSAIVKGPCPKILHNAQYDVLELKRFGIPVGGEIHDTLLMHAVIAPKLPHRLTDVAAFETTAERWKTKFGDLKDDKHLKQDLWGRVELKDLLPYNCKDAQMTAILGEILSPRLDSIHSGRELYNTYRALDDLAMRMRERGIQVDVERFDIHRKNLEKVLLQTRFDFWHSGVPAELGETGSHKSLDRLFFEVFKIQPLRYSELTGKPSLDARTVQHIASMGDSLPSKVARLLLKYRKHAKLLTAYVDKLKSEQIDINDIAHPVWRPWGTRTGRWAANDPALQTIPKPKYNKNKEVEVPGMRDLFRARKGLVLCEADYSQLELRIVALLANDSKLLEWYAAGEDVHTLNACEIFQTKSPSENQRYLAKRVVYGLNYGGSTETIWKSLLIDFPGLPLSNVTKVTIGWFKSHPAIEKWQEDQLALAKKNCYVEAPLSGRRQIYYDGQIVPTEVLNFPIQATAGDIMNRAILAMDKKIDWKNDEAILAQVHDSALIEGPNKARLLGILKETMEQTVELNGSYVTFPVDLSSGESWGYMSKVK